MGSPSPNSHPYCATRPTLILEPLLEDQLARTQLPAFQRQNAVKFSLSESVVRMSFPTEVTGPVCAS